MYVHKKCKPSGVELDLEKKAGGFCSACGIQGTVYHVIGQPDYYEHILNSILYKVRDGKSWTSMEAVWSAARLQTAKVKAARKGENWTAPEPEIAEIAVEAEPVAKKATKALKGAAKALKKAVTKEPLEDELTEETEAVEEVAEEALEEILEELTPEEKQPEETAPEAEPEPSVEEVTVKVKLDTSEADADIARLEAEIEALKKGKK